MSADPITAENFGRNSFNNVEGDDGGGFTVLVDHKVGQHGCKFLHKLAFERNSKSPSPGGQRWLRLTEREKRNVQASG